MDEMVVLDTFSFDVPDVEGRSSFGIIVSSRRVFRNVVTSVSDQGEELVLITDGTYKLHFGGWTVVDCGSIAVCWDRNSFVHRFVPWAYMFVRSESTSAYSRLFSVVRERAGTFFDVEVNVAFGTLDHSEAIASAFQAEWPDVSLLTCWPHLVRNCRKHKHLLELSDNYEDVIKPNLLLLRRARTHAQFLKMSVIVLEYWGRYGENAYANWFRAVYLSSRWNRWHITGLGVGGITPSQQGIEAHHSVIKKTCAPSPRASTNGVLKGILPRILQSDGETLCLASVAHYCESPVPPEMIAKAKLLTSSSRNYSKLKKGRGQARRLVAIIFNASKYIVGGAGILGTEVDARRAEKFVRSLEGRVPRDLKAVEIDFELLSLHRVVIGADAPQHPFHLDPVWSTENVLSVRNYTQCDCHSYMQTGWVCSHILASLSLLGLLDLQAAMASVPVRRAPGRPPNRRSALNREAPEEGYFNEDRLVRLFVAKPGQPLKWKVVVESDVGVEGESERGYSIGEVVGLRLSDGVFVWSVRLPGGDVRDLEVQDLAQAVHRANELGVHVTG